MAYLALYRQYRSRTLAEVVDQGHVVRTLSNAIANNKLVHAYLFTGPRGTGKTSVARVLARSLNCEHGPTLSPCGICASCKAIETGASLDVREIDAASNRGIDDIRDLRQSVHYVAESRYKVYIIDEVHMLSTEAFNALLKTLEEPPEHVIFILATTEVHKIPLTILSRCQRFDFRRIGKAPMIQHLRAVIAQCDADISEEALDLLAERAQGGMRDALSLLDQCLIFADGEIGVDDLLAVLGSVDQETLIRLFHAVYGNETVTILDVLDQIEDSGRDLTQLLYDMMQLMRLVVAKPADYQEALGLSATQAMRALELLARCEVEMKQMSSSRLALELALFRIAEEAVYGGRIEALEARLAALEEGQLAPMRTAAVPSGGQKTTPAAAAVRNTATATGGDAAAQKITPAPQATEAHPQSRSSTSRTPESARVDIEPQVLETTAGQAVGNDLSINAMNGHWEQILEYIRKERISVHAILQHGRVIGVEDGHLELVFVQDFHRKILERPENKTLLEQAVASVSGQSYRVKILLTKDVIGRRAVESLAAPATEQAPIRAQKPEVEDPAPTSQAKSTDEALLLVPTAALKVEDLLVSAAIALVGVDKVKIVN